MHKLLRLQAWPTCGIITRPRQSIFPLTHDTLSTASFTTAQQAKRPLDGITVLSLEQAIAAPFCTRQLADLGARVIKIERPVIGDFARAYDSRVAGLSSHFVWTNRSKESLALDLKKESDMRVVRKLLEKTDVLVQNLAPGAAARLGLGYEELKETYPALIVCDISGYGQDGPYRDKKAYDLLIQSEAGLLSVTGAGTGSPAKVGISVADISAAMYAYSNILAGLLERSKTGKGGHVDVSMLECMAEWMGFPMYYTYEGAEPPAPVGAAHATVFPYGPFQTGEGGPVMLGVQNEREWVNFCKRCLDDESIATDERFVTNVLRSQNRESLTKIICDKFAGSTAAEVLERLDKAGIANANVNDMKGLWRHAQLKARRRWTEVDTPVGPVPALIPPGADGSARMDPVPAVGEHNEKIMAGLGL